MNEALASALTTHRVRRHRFSNKAPLPSPTAALVLHFGAHGHQKCPCIHGWRASPSNTVSHRGLPPAFILSAGFDPLQDENSACARKLEADGVSVSYRHYEDMFHGFISMSGAREA